MRGLKTSQGEMVIPKSLQALRSLLCSATNEVLRDRFFKCSRCSMFGTTAFSWMSEPGRVYVRKHVRDKHDPIVDEVDLLLANQNHAIVRYPEGREDTVSAQDVAATAITSSNGNLGGPSPLPVQVQPELVGGRKTTSSTGPKTCYEPETELQTPSTWRSTRQRKAPDRLAYIA